MEGSKVREYYTNDFIEKKKAPEDMTDYDAIIILNGMLEASDNDYAIKFSDFQKEAILRGVTSLAVHCGIINGVTIPILLQNKKQLSEKAKHMESLMEKLTTKL